MGSFSGGIIPLANSAPASEATAAAAGTGGQASKWDHQHPRLTSATNGVLAANGEATVNFTRSFAAMPSIDFTYVELADNPPVMFKVKSWIQDGSLNYTGCVCKGYRGQTIPQNLVSLLVSAVFNVFGGSASGVQFTCIALQQS